MLRIIFDKNGLELFTFVDGICTWFAIAGNNSICSTVSDGVDLQTIRTMDCIDCDYITTAGEFEQELNKI